MLSVEIGVMRVDCAWKSESWKMNVVDFFDYAFVI